MDTVLCSTLIQTRHNKYHRFPQLFVTSFQQDVLMEITVSNDEEDDEILIMFYTHFTVLYRFVKRGTTDTEQEK